MQPNQVSWEIVVDDRDYSVRRLLVPNGWIYQVQNGRRYTTVPGTIGSETDIGYPIWGQIVFVHK